MRMTDGFLCIGILLLTGCYNSSVQLMPADQAVKAVRQSNDCATIVFGLGGGTATLEQALAKPAQLINDTEAPRVPITKVRAVAYQNYYALFFGGHCVEVTGE